MKFKDAGEYQKRTGKVPDNIVMAFEEPAEIGEVVMHGPFRFRVSKALSRDEFMVQLRDSQKRPDAVSGRGEVRRSKLDIETAVDISEPGPEFKYFYAAELVRGRGDGR